MQPLQPFGFAQPLQRRLVPGAQAAALAMQQVQQGDDPAIAAQKAMMASKPSLPPLAPAQAPSGQATMMPDTSLPPLVPPTVSNGTDIEDPSAALPAGSMGDGLDAAGGDGMAIGDLIAALFG